MGRGPEEAIFRKLVNRYFKFDLKRSNFKSATTLYPDLYNSNSKNGPNSPQSKLILEKIDALYEKDEQEYREMKKMVKDLPYKLNQMVPKKKTKYQQKGRNQRVPYHFRPKTMRDLLLEEKEEMEQGQNRH